MSASSSGSGSSGSGGLISGLFFSAGEGEVEVRRDSRRSESRDGRELGRGRDVTRGRFMGPRRQPAMQTQPRADLPLSQIRAVSTAAVSPSSVVQSAPLPELLGISSFGSSTEEVGQYDDENEEPPSLVTSSGDISSYQYPFYHNNGTIAEPNLLSSRFDLPQFQAQPPLAQSQSQSSPPPLASPTPLSPLSMAIPVPSSAYPHPAQYTTHAYAHPSYTHTTHTLPLPAVPLHSPTSSSPSAASPSPTSSTRLQLQRDRQTLRKGDVLYWHHLQRSGEIPGVEEDERARVGSSGGGTSKGVEKAGQGLYLGMVIGGR